MQPAEAAFAAQAAASRRRGGCAGRLEDNPDPTLPVSYKLVIKIDAGTDPEVGADDATEAMHQPFVNISHSGRVTCCVQSLKKDPVFNIPQ